MIPLERKSLFWDTDATKLDITKHAKYIIERIFDFGRDADVRWLWATYDKSMLKEVVNNSRSIKSSTKNLWTLVLKN